MFKSVDKNNPCFRCETRELYCHSWCERYKEYISSRRRFEDEEIVKYQKKNYRKRWR